MELNKYAPHIRSVLTQYEEADVRAHLVTDELNQLADWLSVSASQGVQHQASTQALQKMFKKLRGYMSENASVRFCQPAVKFFRASCVFDVVKAKILNVSHDFVCENIP